MQNVWLQENTPRIFDENIAIGRLRNFRLMLDEIPFDEIIKRYKYPERAFFADLGTGSGRLAEMIARNYPQVAVYGIDISPHMIAYAEKRISDSIRADNRDREDYRRMKLHFLVGRAESTNLPDNFFDGVISSDLLQWHPNPSKVVEEIYRITKPNGIVEMKTVTEYSYFHAKEAGKYFADNNPMGFNVFCGTDLRQMFEKAGFVVSIKHLPPEQSTSIESYLGRIRALTNDNSKKFLENPQVRNRVVRYFGQVLNTTGYLMAEDPIVAVGRVPANK